MADRRRHTIYGVRIHDRDTEDDPVLGTVMYSTNGDCGPWHDMATGHPDFAWEIMEALDLAQQRQAHTDAETWQGAEHG